MWNINEGSIIYIGVYILVLSWLVLLVISKNNKNISMVSLSNNGIKTNNVPVMENMVSAQIVRKYSLLVSIILLYIALLWWYNYDPYVPVTITEAVANESGNVANMEDMNKTGWISIGLDGISLYFVLLIGVILPISILSGWYFKSIESNLYYIIVLGLGILLLVNFLCLELLSFYVLFESTLIPLFLLIGLYGSANKEKAAYYVLLYTLFGSLFMLISLCMTSYLLKTTSYYVYSNLILSIDIQTILWLGLFIAIMIKSPLYPLHIWLPVVHSESPLAGSILLAGLVLKLTIYLIIRWLLPVLSEGTLLFTPFVYLICVLTIIIVSLITIIQVDLKVIIAYSSVSHMSVCILGVFANNIIGIEGSYLLSIAHGLISPGLFIAVGGILYDRYHTRIVTYYNGLLSFMPLFSLYFIILSFANVGTPLSANFLGEFFSVYGAFKSSPILASIATLSVLLSATYQMKLTNRITGGYSSYIYNVGDITSRESLMLVSLILPTLLLGIYPQFMLNDLYYILSSSVYSL